MAISPIECCRFLGGKLNVGTSSHVYVAGVGFKFAGFWGLDSSFSAKK